MPPKFSGRKLVIIGLYEPVCCRNIVCLYPCIGLFLFVCFVFPGCLAVALLWWSTFSLWQSVFPACVGEKA